MPIKHSSRVWLKEHFSDSYVKKAHKVGYRSRAAYKLLEINDRDHLFTPGMVVVELGAAPGGWSQVLSNLVGSKGRVIAVDLLPIESLTGVEFIQGDFTLTQVVEEIKASLGSTQIDWVVSDMAPNMSGNESIDVPRSIYLAELALDFALSHLREKGGFLVKVLQGEGFDELTAKVKLHFQRTVIRKPKASRGRSREVYLMGRDLKIK